MLYGLIGLHLTKADLHAGYLLTANRSDVSSYFGINPMQAVPHESTPAIRIERPGPLSDYVDALVGTMNTAGQRLKELGEPDLARFILAALKGEEAPTAARLVAALGAAFPTIFGEALPTASSSSAGDGGFVPHKKALLLAGECFHRLRHALPDLAFTDFARAPGYATPAVITQLVGLGVLRAPETANVEDEDEERAALLGDPDRVAVLSAAAVLALDAWAAKWGVAPLDLAYCLDEGCGKERAQQAQQEQEQEQPQGQEQQQQGGEKQEAPKAKFVPPRGQRVM